MTESEARAAKISEVWAEFQHIYETSKSGQWKTAFGLKMAAYISMLRAVLLERCEKIRISNWSLSFCIAGNQLMVSCNSLTYYADSDTTNELADIYAFWAWELKQRQNESNGR